MKLKNWIATLAGAAMTFVAGHAAAQTAPIDVGLELMLLVDVSGSVDTTEYNLQKTGYVNAFNSTAVQNAILGSQGGKIAVTYIEWSGTSQQSTRVNWSLIDSAASATDFATALSGVTRAYSGSTAIQDAIGKSYSLFGTEVGGNENGFTSSRQVIDVSGDGADNNSTTYTTAGSGRTAAINAGVDAINGIPILGETGLLAYYTNYVKGGANGFVLSAANFGDFAAAIQSKLVKEITGDVPEPASLALVGLALLGLTVSRRRSVKR